MCMQQLLQRQAYALMSKDSAYALLFRRSVFKSIVTHSLPDKNGLAGQD